MSLFSVSSGRSLDSTLRASLNVFGNGSVALEPVSFLSFSDAATFSAIVRVRSVNCRREEILYTVREPTKASIANRYTEESSLTIRSLAQPYAFRCPINAPVVQLHEVHLSSITMGPWPYSVCSQPGVLFMFVIQPVR